MPGHDPAPPASPSSKEDDAKKRRRVERLVTGVEEMLHYRAEAGLFGSESEGAGDGKDGRITTRCIHNKLSRARRLAESGDFPGANKRVAEAEALLHTALYTNRGVLWRLLHIHQAGLYTYYFLVLALLLNAETGWLQPWLPLTSDVWDVPLEILLVGALGGVLRGLWWLYQKVQARKFRVQFTMIYVAGPWMGALLGLLAYLLLQVGALTLQANGAGTTGDAASTGALTVAFLAGFSWEWVMAAVDQVVERNGGATAGDDDSGAPAGETRTSSAEGEEIRANSGARRKGAALVRRGPHGGNEPSPRRAVVGIVTPPGEEGEEADRRNLVAHPDLILLKLVDGREAYDPPPAGQLSGAPLEVSGLQVGKIVNYSHPEADVDRWTPLVRCEVTRDVFARFDAVVPREELEEGVGVRVRSRRDRPGTITRGTYEGNFLQGDTLPAVPMFEVKIGDTLTGGTIRGAPVVRGYGDNVELVGMVLEAFEQDDGSTVFTCYPAHLIRESLGQ